MKKYLIWSGLIMKRQLNYKIFLVFLIVLPISAFIISKIPQLNEESVPRIGICLQDDDVLSTAAFNALISADKSVIEYYPALSEEALRLDIINGSADCGYIFEKDLSSRIMSGNIKDSVKLLKSPDSVMAPLSNEIVFSALFREFGKDIAVSHVENAPVFGNVKKSVVKFVDERFDHYLNGPATFHVEFKTVETSDTAGGRTDLAADTSLFPLKGILAVLIFAAGLFGSVQWLNDKSRGVFNAFPARFAHLSRIAYTLVPAVLFTLSSLLTLIVTKQYVRAGIFSEISDISVYMMIVTIFSSALTFIIKSSRLMTAFIPITILCSILCCPVFFDLSVFMPFIAVIRRFLIPFYYLTA